MPTWGTSGYGSGKYGLPPIKSLTIGYYLSIITSEYQTAANFLQWTSDILEVLDDNNQCLQQFDPAFDVNQAVGAQQDILGQLVGFMRTVNVRLPGGGAGSNYITLPDDEYRLALRSAIAKNNWLGTVDELQDNWNKIFPNNPIIVMDAGNMSATIWIGGTLSAIEQELVLADLIVPRPATVQYYYTFSPLPIFGCDFNNSTIAGVDTGYLS